MRSAHTGLQVSTYGGYDFCATLVNRQTDTQTSFDRLNY